MAKITFTKLNLNKDNLNTVTIKFNDLDIEVKEYLPVEEKLDLISNVLNSSIDKNNFPNPLKIEISLLLEIVYHYTNISFTEKQKENSIKLYDLIVSNGLSEMVINAIPKKEYDDLISKTYETITRFYNYQQSVLGILDTISADYSNLEYDANKIKNELADPNNMELLKNVLTKLG